MSSSRRLCLSRKRERVVCNDDDDTHDDMSDDLQDAATVFRFAKRLRTGKSQGKSKRSVPDPDIPKDQVSSAKKDPPDDNITNSTSPHHQNTEQVGNEISTEDADLQEIERTLCSESEKLCPSCKLIVPSAVFTDHFKECLQKFKRAKRSCNKIILVPDGEEEINEQAEQQPVLPCPVCKKAFKSKIQRVSHIKACAQGHGLTSEQLLLASRLLEKQTEEWSDLGLPTGVQPLTTRPKAQRTVKNTKDLNDPDIAMALALSRSMAEEEIQSRVSKEEQLLALGMDDIVNEDRKVKPVLLPPSDPVFSKMSAKQKKKTTKNRKGSCRVYKTSLVTRSVEERERLISEKVAVLLTADDTASVGWTNSATPKHSRRLARLVNKPCQLWKAARSGADEPLHSFYVSDLQPYIQPKETVVGSLFRHLSQIPGRLNTTVLHAMDEESESEGETEAASEVQEEFCTQMALAELMGSLEEQDSPSETEWEQAPEEMEQTQGFLLPSQVFKTQGKSKLNTSLLDNDAALQDCEPNGKQTVDMERDIKENSDDDIQVYEIKENIVELKEDSNLKNKTGLSPLIEEPSDMCKEKYENVPCRKQDNSDHNTDPHVTDDHSDNECESIEGKSESMRSSQPNKRKVCSQERSTLHNGPILYDSTKDTQHVSDKGTSSTTKVMSAQLHLGESRKLTSKKYAKGLDSHIDSKDQSQKHESGIDITSNFAGRNTTPTPHSLHSVPSPDNNGGRKYDSDEEQLGSSPLHSSQYRKDVHTTPTKACSLRNNALHQSIGKDCSKTRKLLEHEKATSTLKEKTPMGNSSPESGFMVDTLIKNWRDILQSGLGSDVTIKTSDGASLTAHSLVLLARCPELYKESKTCENFIKWDNIPQKTAHHFLSYLYTGTCEVITPGDPLWIELYDVALRYNCTDLVSYMELLYKAKRTPVKIPNASLQTDLGSKNSFVNLNSAVSSAREVVKCSTPSPEIPVVNLEEDLELRNSPSNSMSDSTNKFMVDCGKTLKPIRLFSERTQGELCNTTSPEKKVSELALPLPHKEKDESEHLQRYEGTFSPDLFDDDSPCFRSVTTSSSVSHPPVIDISQHSPRVKQVQSVAKEQGNICHVVPKTSPPCKVSLSGKEKEHKEMTSIEDIVEHEQEQNILGAGSVSPLPSLSEGCEANDHEKVIDLSQSGSEASVTDLLVSDCQTENVRKDSIERSDCIDNENEDPPICEPVDTHDCYISNIWDDFDGGGSSMVVFEEDIPSVKSPTSKVCEKIKDVGKLDSCVTPLTQSSSRQVASTPLLQHEDSAQRDMFNGKLQLTKPRESECLKQLETKSTVSAKVDSVVFTEDLASDETLMNMAVEVEQWDDDVHEARNEALSKAVTPIDASYSTPARPHQSTPARLSHIYLSKRSEVTPLPDYKNMKSPDLKKELKKYGICSLGRKNAVKILQHVYEQTHPLVTDSEAESSYSQTPQRNAATDRPKLLPPERRKKRDGLASEQKELNKKNGTGKETVEKYIAPAKANEREEEEESEESPLNSSLSSTSSEGSSGYLFGEAVLPHEEEDNISSTQQCDLTSQVREIIMSNRDLHRKVLLYEPIFVEDLHALLKANKIKCSIQALLDVLDDLALIVRTQANQNRGQGRTSKKNRKTSPKKTPEAEAR